MRHLKIGVLVFTINYLASSVFLCFWLWVCVCEPTDVLACKKWCAQRTCGLCPVFRHSQVQRVQVLQDCRNFCLFYLGFFFGYWRCRYACSNYRRFLCCLLFFQRGIAHRPHLFLAATEVYQAEKCPPIVSLLNCTRILAGCSSPLFSSVYFSLFTSLFTSFL